MSNEELAAAAQTGDQDAIMQLWSNVRGYAWKQAHRWAGVGRGAEPEDLAQCAFLALLDAVDGYRPERGAFISWYVLRMKEHYTRATGQRTRREQFEPLQNSVSLYAPLSGFEDMTLIDAIGDPNAAQGFQDVEARMWTEQLHTSLDKAICWLPEAQADVIRKRFWDGLSYHEIADSRGLSAVRVRKIMYAGLRSLRQNRELQELAGADHAEIAAEAAKRAAEDEERSAHTRARMKAYRERNAAKIAAYKRAYRETHREEIAEYQRRYHSTRLVKAADTEKKQVLQGFL